jgi:hypothetical protein
LPSPGRPARGPRQPTSRTLRIGIEREDRGDTDDQAEELGDDEPGHRGRCDPANVSVKARPTVTARFANAVDDVNQYAAPM